MIDAEKDNLKEKITSITNIKDEKVCKCKHYDVEIILKNETFEATWRCLV